MAGKFIKTAFVTLALLPALASAQIYRWVDENGKVHYSDKAPPGVKVETKNYSNVATPFRKAPSDLYLKDEEPESEEGEEVTDEAVTDDGEEGVSESSEEQNTAPEDQNTVDEDLLTDEEKAEKAKKEEEDYHKLKEQYQKVKDDYRKARKDRSTKSD